CSSSWQSAPSATWFPLANNRFVPAQRSYAILATLVGIIPSRSPHRGTLHACTFQDSHLPRDRRFTPPPAPPLRRRPNRHPPLHVPRQRRQPMDGALLRLPPAAGQHARLFQRRRDRKSTRLNSSHRTT